MTIFSKVMSLQSLQRQGKDPRPLLSIVILAESNQAILTIVDCQLWKPITLLQIAIDSLIVFHLKDLIHIWLEPEDQNLSSTFKILYLNLNRPQFAS